MKHVANRGHARQFSRLRALFVYALLSSLTYVAWGVSAKSAEYLVGAKPAWAVMVPPVESASPVTGTALGRWYLLVDSQVRIESSNVTVYRHVAVKALNEAGVEGIAQIEIEFDPSYETVTLHDVLVRRNDVRQ